MGGLRDSPPVVLAIGGSDCSAGAGIQADLKAIHENGGYALTVVTGVVAETPQKVVSFDVVSPELVEQQIQCLLETFPVSAVKIGLLFSPEIVEVVSCALQGRDIPVVIDPVGAASVGAAFGGEFYLQALVKTLFPQGQLITPNIPEAQLLLELGSSERGAEELAIAFSERFQVPVLLKGGHSNDSDLAADLFSENGKLVRTYSASRLRVPDLHGTGCTLASAIATHVARGKSVEKAIGEGKGYLRELMGNYWTWGEEVYALGAKVSFESREP